MNVVKLRPRSSQRPNRAEEINARSESDSAPKQAKLRKARENEREKRAGKRG